MSKTILSGALCVTGQQPSVNGAPVDYNGDAGPSLFYMGAGLLDPRDPVTASGPDAGVASGFVGNWWTVLDQVPSAIATANIAALANVVNGTAMTLVAASGAGITVMTAPFNAVQTGLVVPTAARAIDGLPAMILFGSNNAWQIPDPNTQVARAVSITGSTSATGGTFVVKGYDLYGNPQTENIVAGAGAVTTNGKKAFKWVLSVTPQFTDAHNYSVGTTDIYGFPLRVDRFFYADLDWNNALISASTGFVAADTTNPATATTGDVRATYAVQSASDGTKRLQMAVSIPPANLAAGIAGLFGVTPF